MKTKVDVMIGGRIFTLVAEEDVGYTKEIAAYVDGQMNSLMEQDFSYYEALMLTAVNIADEFFREREKIENLRGQLKDYVEDASKAKLELAEARREISRLKKEQPSE